MNKIKNKKEFKLNTINRKKQLKIIYVNKIINKSLIKQI